MPPNPLSLKQRLAALSISPSAPAIPHGQEPPRTPLEAKRKILFNPPWVRRPQPSAKEYGQLELVQEVVAKLIFQAGVDFETRPMVCVNASALPDPKDVNYDLLLSRTLSYLNLYVESDYTVVFFTAGGKHTPGWNWVWKAHRSLSRKYRKNLKRLYIVHSSFFSKSAEYDSTSVTNSTNRFAAAVLFSLAGAIISPKFFRKIIYIATLSELAHHIPLTQIDIPPAVYQENLKHEREITLPMPTRSSLFGVPLEELMGYNGEKGGVPRVVKDAIQYLHETGMMEVGLFRRSPQSVMLKAAQEAYDRGHVVSLETFGDPHLAAVLLKKYLRDLPEPIFPENLYPVIARCPTMSRDPADMTSIAYIRETLLPEIPPCSYILLSAVLHLMHEVSLRSASNRMDAYNLAIVLCPNLVKGSNPARDVMMCAVPGGPSITSSALSEPTSPRVEGKTTLGAIVYLCIQRYYEVFDEIWDRSEAVPPSRSDVRAEAFAASERSSASASPRPVSHNDDDEDIDDAMLVMPIGPNNGSAMQDGNGHAREKGPPSAWANGAGVSNGQTFKARLRNANSGGSSTRTQGMTATASARSVHTTFGDPSVTESIGGNGLAYASMGRSRSMISIENGAGTVGRKGSIAVGRGTMRKSSGAGVEAIGITAEGFFTPPSTAPPVPPVVRTHGDSKMNAKNAKMA